MDGKSRTMGKADDNTGNEQPFNSATVHKISKEMGSIAMQKNPAGRVLLQTKRECPFWCVRVLAREGMQDVNIHSYQFHAWGLVPHNHGITGVWTRSE